MIQLEASRSKVLGLLALVSVGALIVVGWRWQRLADLAPTAPLIAFLLAELVVVSLVGFRMRPRLRLENGELEFRPRFGFIRRIPLHSTSAVVWAPVVRLTKTRVTTRFAILTVDGKPFALLDAPPWDLRRTTELINSAQPKGVLLPMTTTLADLRANWQPLLTLREKHPGLAILRTAGLVLLGFAILAFALLLLAGSMR